MLISGKPLICIEEETEAQFTSAPDPERTCPLSQVKALFLPQPHCGTSSPTPGFFVRPTRLTFPL